MSLPYRRMWEWVVDHGADNAPSGVCWERHRAMEALSLTLIAVSGSASGRVVPLALVDGAFGFGYVRMAPELTADYERGVIRWQLAETLSAGCPRGAVR